MRIKVMGITFICILGVLSLRIFYFSTVKSSALSRQALAQRTQKVEFKTARGVIYDRNMISITEGQNASKIAVIPEECEDLELVSRIIGQKINPNGMQIFSLSDENDEQYKLLDMKGIKIFSVSERYNDYGLLSHVIGYTSQNGGFGIERAFNKQLTINQTDSFSLIKDAKSNVIPGFGYKKTNAKTYAGVKLTIDYHIQKIAENAMDSGNIDGAVVIADAETGEILAMASRPNFQQNEIAKYLNSSRGELVNRAVSSYDIGSVFKILISAAALETSYVREVNFVCNGKVDIDGREFVCNKSEGHGHLSFDEGLAYSCNSVFYEIGNKIGIDNIHNYATAFGFGEKVLNINEIFESKGNIPFNKNATRQEIANISIGQGAVSVTPLQIADMLCTILNDGVRKQLSLVKSIVKDDGSSSNISPVTLGRVISTDTARILKSMLIGVVKYGTGTGANIKNVGAGGKTSSAQTGWLKDGEVMTHGWFAGFFPAENPKYICVVLAENGKTGSQSAVPVFRRIGEEICNSADTEGD